MAFRKSGLLSLGAFLLLTTSANAAEEFAKGMAVARELVARDGHRFVFTVTPPPDRSVDPRVFDLFDVDDRVEKGANRVVSAKKRDPEPEDIEALDLSDYRIRIEALAMASCNIDVPMVKFKKVNLNGGKGVGVETIGASTMFVTAYPTKGDVDALITFGPEETLCNISERGAGQLDLAKCFDSSCNTTGGSTTGIIINPLSSQAQYVGAITVTIAR